MQALDQYKIRRPPIAQKQTRFTKEKQETEGQMRDSWFFFIFHDSQEEEMTVVVMMMKVLG